MKGAILYGLDDCTIVCDNPSTGFTIDITGYSHGFLKCSDGTMLEFRVHGVCDIMLKETGRYYDYTDYWTCEDDRSDCVHFSQPIERIIFEPID